MNEELMRQNLENNRYQSSGIVDNIVTMGIANSSLENVVKNSLAKESSAAFQFAMGNGGIYRNNALMGSSNLYRLVRFLTPESLRSNQSSNLFGLGRYEVNKFSVGQIDPKRQAKMSELSRNISSNLPDWDPKSDIIPTGIGFQNKGYKEFFTQLDKIGFELDKAKSAEVNLTDEQYKIYKGLRNGDSKYNYIKSDKSKNLLSKSENIDTFVNNRYDPNINKLNSELKNLSEQAAKETDKVKKKSLLTAKNKKTEELAKIIKEKQEFSKSLYDEKAALDFYVDGKMWNSENFSDDMFKALNKRLDSVIKNGIDFNNKDTIKQLENFLDDFDNLGKSLQKIGKVSKDNIKQIDKMKKILDFRNYRVVREYAIKHGISESEAVIRMQREAVKFLSKDAKVIFGNFSDDAAKIFTTKTGFQKFMGNNATRFLTGVQSGMSSFLWQLPLMVVSATASINQENAIQNFVSSYLYNPKNKEMYNNEATNRSMQISQNIHYSNLQDTQNIIIKHNTAERYLNDLDPINIDLDYSQKSFDLNPRNE